MGKTKNLDQLLRELNEMQMQFDNLKDEMVTKNSTKKKNMIKTELSSDKIDTDFFKTLATAPKINNSSKVTKKTNNSLDKIKELENTTDDLLFSLDIEHEEITNNNDTTIEEINTPLEIIEEPEESVFTDLIPDSESTSNNKEEGNLNSNVQILKSEEEINKIAEEIKPNENVSEKSFLSIKQKLDKIKEEIAYRELQISNEKNKVIQLTKENKETDFIAEKVLAPKLEAKIEKENFKKHISNKDTKIENFKQKNKKDKRDTVDILTIIILVLLIVLIITAWTLLK